MTRHDASPDRAPLSPRSVDHDEWTTTHKLYGLTNKQRRQIVKRRLETRSRGVSDSQLDRHMKRLQPNLTELERRSPFHTTPTDEFYGLLVNYKENGSSTPLFPDAPYITEEKARAFIRSQYPRKQVSQDAAHRPAGHPLPSARILRRNGVGW